MTLTEQAVRDAADRLHAAELNRKQIEPLTLAYPEMDMDDAYAIQAAWVSRKIESGREVVGYKIGLTSRAMQRAMKIDSPDYGVLLDDMVFDNGSTLDAGAFLDPQVEVELAFVLKKKLFGEDLSIADVLDATDYVVPAFELIAARSYRVHPKTGYTRTIMDTISDNAANAGIIVGDCRINPAEVDLRWCGAIVKVNDVIEHTGLAAAVLDHPANGICWAARRFAPHGIALEPGQTILSGSFTAPVKVGAGDVVQADYGRFGKIKISFR